MAIIGGDAVHTRLAIIFPTAVGDEHRNIQLHQRLCQHTCDAIGADNQHPTWFLLLYPQPTRHHAAGQALQYHGADDHGEHHGHQPIGSRITAALQRQGKQRTDRRGDDATRSDPA